MQPAPQEGLETGVPRVDSDHHLHAEMIAALDRLIRIGDDPALAERTLAQLVDFTRAHFLSEEMLMRLYAYPRLDQHQQQHEGLTARVREIQLALAAGARWRAVEALGELRAALLDHIRDMDQDFARSCLEIAVKDVRAL